MRGLVVLLICICGWQVESFLKPVFNKAMRPCSLDKALESDMNRLQPLNTNPRKIDVGEEASTRFGKVRTR